MKYRKKPVEVDAMQYDGHNAKAIKNKFKDIKLFVRESPSYGGTMPVSTVLSIPVEDLENVDPDIRVYPVSYIATLEGDMKVKICDWIVKGVNGEYYPVKPDIFEKTYEKVEEI